MPKCITRSQTPSVLGVEVGGFTKNAIPQDSCYTQLAGVQTAAYPPLGVVGQMLGIMAPPGAVVVPEMMIRVLGDESDCEFGLGAHVCDVWVGHQKPGQ